MAWHAVPTRQGPFRILAVCSGNICRSPQAEQLLRLRLPDALPAGKLVEVESAGTMARVGEPVHAQATAELLRLGVPDDATHVSRQVTTAMVARADLVLGLAREHRSAVLRLDPRANHRVFTLVEFTRVAELMVERGDREAPEAAGLPGSGLCGVVKRAGMARGLLPFAAAKDIDIEDPYGKSGRHYRRSADAVAEYVDRLAVALGSLVGPA